MYHLCCWYITVGLGVGVVVVVRCGLASQGPVTENVSIWWRHHEVKHIEPQHNTTGYVSISHILYRIGYNNKIALRQISCIMKKSRKCHRKYKYLVLWSTKSFTATKINQKEYILYPPSLKVENTEWKHPPFYHWQNQRRLNFNSKWVDIQEWRVTRHQYSPEKQNDNQL